MKSETASKIGVLDALTSGLVQATQRPWLLIIPAAIDLALWLMPRLSISRLLLATVDRWEGLVRLLYTPGQFAQMADTLGTLRKVMSQIGSELNLAEVFAGSWLGAPSAVATVTSTRLTFISDMVLAPMGLSVDLPHMTSAPWQNATIEMGSWWTVIALVLLGWLVSQLLAALYLRWAAHGWRSGQADNNRTGDQWAGSRGLLSLVARVAGLCLLLSVMVFLLRLPLGVAVTLMILSGGGALTMLFVFVGGVTLWLLTWFLASFFFACEAVILDRQPLLKAIWQSLILVRLNGWPTFGLLLIINVVLLGFRAVWGLIGRTPAGAAVAILGNAYLATGMLLGIFTYYDELRRRWQVQLAKIGKPAISPGNNGHGPTTDNR